MPEVTLKSPPAGLPARIAVSSEGRTGGEGAVYFSLDGRYAIKVYHRPRQDKETLLGRVMEQFRALTPDQARFILPPLALVAEMDGRARVGFVMRRVPPRQRELLDFMLNPVAAAAHFRQGKTWGQYLRLARSVANAVVVLHGKGFAHSDIHYRNFLGNLEDGDAVMLEIDGVVVPGPLPPQVKGMMGFMAPEILAEGALPTERTDRHSLAVLILHTLLFRNVMTPLVDYDADCDRSEKLGWGEQALFSEDPRDRRHRPRALGMPLFSRGALSYRMLTPALQELTERAFVHALRVPDERPSSREWADALAWAVDELWGCTVCRQNFPYPWRVTPAARRQCPFCGGRLPAPHPAVVSLCEERQRGAFAPINRRVVLGPGYKLFAYVTEPGKPPPFSRTHERAAGHVERDGAARGLRLVNDEPAMWTALSADGARRFTIGRGESLNLERGLQVLFGSGRRLGLVESAGGTA